VSQPLFFYQTLDWRTYVCYNGSSATLHGRRLASTESNSSVYIEIPREILIRRFVIMLTTDILIAIISLCVTCFALGYTVGSKSNDKTQK